MPMYTPPAFREDDVPTLHAMMRAAPLATFVTAGPGGLMATPLPLFIDPDEGRLGTLYGHVARANPQWREGATEALAVFMGPDAYVTPSWYATKRETGKVVPTWNYVAVHAGGPVAFTDDPARLLELVTRLRAIHEAARPEPWAVSDAPEAFVRAQLKGIVGFRMPILRLEGKRKMSQNRPAADRAGVADGLAESPREADRASAALVPRD